LRTLLAGAGVFLAAALAAGSLAIFQSVEAQRESDSAERAARVALARELAFASLGLPAGSELSILLAREAVETTRRTYRIVTPEAQDALITANAAGGSYTSYFSRPVKGEPSLLPDGLPFKVMTLPSGDRAVVADIEQLLQVARLLVKRPLTSAECRQYLHVPACPQPG
jgi:hypothetical protein